MNDVARVVITGVGLSAPNGNDLREFRANLLAGKSGIGTIDTHYMGSVIAGTCDFDASKYQTKKELRRGTRAGSFAVYCSHEAVTDAKLDLNSIEKSRIGVYLGIAEHGNVQTEKEIYNMKQYNYDYGVVSHHYIPRSIANEPAAEITINMGITGPHCTIGGACAAGNLGLIYGTQMLRLGEVDFALTGGVSEIIRSFGFSTSFKNQGILASHPNPRKASRPFDRDRNGVVVSEGGCICVLEKVSTALERGAKIYGEIVGDAMNSDAFDYALPNPDRQAECMNLAISQAGISASDIGIINTHATGTPEGDKAECQAIREVLGNNSSAYINNTKSYIGHAMGAAGALELVGNLPSFDDNIVHQTINVDNLDPDCALENLVINKPRKVNRIDYILSNSFGMLGINTSIVVRRFTGLG